MWHNTYFRVENPLHVFSDTRLTAILFSLVCLNACLPKHWPRYQQYLSSYEILLHQGLFGLKHKDHWSRKERRKKGIESRIMYPNQFLGKSFWKICFIYMVQARYFYADGKSAYFLRMYSTISSPKALKAQKPNTSLVKNLGSGFAWRCLCSWYVLKNVCSVSYFGQNRRIPHLFKKIT